MEIGDLLRRAASETGDEYLRAERQIRENAAAAPPVLRTHLQETDPFLVFTARTLLGWFGAQAAEYQAALSYLDTLPNRLARTPIVSPSPTGAAAYLAMHFGNRIADLMSLRLSKSVEWPHWRVMAVLFYLRDQAAISATPGLVRYAVETNNDEYRTTALQALRASTHPGLAGEIAAERERAKRLDRVFPAELNLLSR